MRAHAILQARGEVVAVTEDHCVAAAEACAIHDHDSRSIAAFRSKRTGIAERTLRIAVALTAMTPLLVPYVH